MAWIDRVENVNGSLVPVCIGSDGLPAEGSLADCKAFLNRVADCGSRLAAKNLDLRTLKLGNCAEYTEALAIRGHAHRHQVYEILVDGIRVTIPAVLLISSLIGRLRAVEGELFSAASLSRVAQPLIAGAGAPRIRFPRRGTLLSGLGAECLQQQYAWLTCFASGRQFWSNVYLEAQHGHLAACPVEAVATTTLRGARYGGSLYATRMSIEFLRPTEPPLGFAQYCSASQFVFRNSDGHREQRRENPWTPFTTREHELKKSSSGWATTDEEWNQISARIRAQKGLYVRSPARRLIDVCIEKMGTGIPWKSFGGQAHRACNVYCDWNKSGKWQVVKDVLEKTRS